MMKQLIKLWRCVSLVAVGLMFTGCATSGGGGPAIRVGVTPDYPPIIYKDGANIVGVEADFARRVGQELGRSVEFVELKWEQQIPALLRGDIDVVMSGMSVTPEREVRVQFADSYFKTGLMALIRRKDAGKYDSPASLLNHVATVGVKRGTTADTYVQEKMPNARKLTYMLPSDAAFDVKRKKIDVFIHDGPSVAWLASENEGELTGLFSPLSEERLAWAVRRGDTRVLNTANEMLAKWKSDGTLDKILTYWMPYYEKLK